MRLFIAIDLPRSFKAELARIQKEVKGISCGGRFVPANNFHITLHFIGESRDLQGAVAAMHEAGILHRDFSPGNILFEENAGGCRFSIVDINRMRFGRVSVERGCRNFARLWGQIGFFRILADEYAAARHADHEHCFDVMRKARAKFWKRFSKRHKVKYRLEL